MLLGVVYPLKKSSFDLSLFNRIKDKIKFNDCIVEEQRFSNLFITNFGHPNLKKGSIQQYTNDSISVLVIGHVYSFDNSLAAIFDGNENVAEFLAKQFAELHTNLFDRLNGDYSIIIQDHNKDETFLVKDHLGIVPLAVASYDDCLYFSSDMNALSSALFSKEPIREEFIQSLFYDYEENYSFTPNENVIRVLPGHYIHYKDSQIEQKKYWFPEEIIEDQQIPFQQALSKLKELVLDSVAIRSDMHYTAGSHLSGGLDSGLVSVLVNKEYSSQEKYHCFTWSPGKCDTSNIPYDERVSVKKQCKEIGADLVYTDIDVSDYNKYAEDWRAPSELLFEGKTQDNATRLNVNLMFSGWGGDEFIGLRDEALLRENLRKGRFGAFVRLNRKKGFVNKLKAIVNNGILLKRKRVYFNYKIRPDAYVFVKDLIPTNELRRDQTDWLHSKNDYQIGLINYHHLSQRCEDWYIQGQKRGIEYRYPLLDKRIIEYCLRLPVELFTGKDLDRPLLREVCKDYLIPDITNNMKQLDPALMKNASTIEQQAIKEFILELDEFEKNIYLEKVDFNMLRSEIRRIEQENQRIPRPIANIVFHLKRINEYTKQYHS